MFNSVGVICKPNDFTSQKTALELGVLLKDLDVKFLQDKEDIINDADLIIVVGGDGTILNTARTYVDSNIPILGVNLGRLGFLADVSVDSMASVVTEILNGEFIKEQRSLLSCQIEKNGKVISDHLAFNEVVIHRNETPRMIEFELHVDDDFVKTDWHPGKYS